MTITNDPTGTVVSKWRQAFPQILACMVKNLLLFDLGLSFGLPTVLIPALRGYLTERNPGETLHFTPEQSSWFASIGLLTQLFAGWFTDTIGRRRTMFIVNIPHVIAWIWLYKADSATEIYIVGILLGLGIGLMESSVISYIGEISHPSIRGILLAVSNTSGSLGSMMMFLAGSLMSWRLIAIICVSVPIAAILLLILIPETPYWLLTQHNDQQALRSLQWLRGWVPELAVRQEFDQMKEFVNKTYSCLECQRESKECPHKRDYCSRLPEIVQRTSRRPFLLVLACFVVSHWCGMAATMRPFRVQIFKVFRLPIDPSWMSSILGITELVAITSTIILVKLIGKRRLFLASMCSASVCCLAISVNAFLTIPRGASSFDESYVNRVQSNDNTFALVAFVVMSSLCGLAAGIPWMLLSEMFPIRVRAAGTGLSAATAYLSLFILTKTYINLEAAISIGGCFMFYGVITLIGCGFLYKVLPETEGFTLEEIESYFATKDRAFTDRKIRKTYQTETSDTQF